MFRSLSLALTAVLSISTLAGAQDFPAGPVTIVSPYQAGGTSDIIVRILAQHLGEQWKQTVVVENKPGANGGIGVTTVLRAPSDGHTLLAVASSALTLNPIFYSDLSYNVERDLAPITRTGVVTNVLVVHKSVQATTVSELIALAKAKPGALTYASQGTGSNGHVIGELFKLRAGIDMLHVPYRGSAPAVRDLIGGQVQVMFDNLPSVMPHIRSGALRGLAVTTAARSEGLSELPTIAETGLSEFDASAWFAILVSKTTPEPLRARIERDVISALAAPDVVKRLRAAGVTPAAGGSADLAARIKRETKTWMDVVARAGIKTN